MASQRREQGGARRAVPRPLPRHRPAVRRHRHRRSGRHRRQPLHLGRPPHQPAQPAGRQPGVLRADRAASSGAWAAVAGLRIGRRSSSLIYIWVGVFSVLAPSQVWTLANYVMTTREAKRSFGFIGSGAILGWIVGGLATRTAVSRFGTESMLALRRALAASCAPAIVVDDLARSARLCRQRHARVRQRARLGFRCGAACALIRESRLPEGDRGADSDRGADHDDRRVAVQGHREGRPCPAPTSWRCSSAPST